MPASTAASSRTISFPLGAPRSCGRRAGGFTLLEVLVSIVVLSFGVLGVVGLQAASMQANKEAKYQSSAVRLARELADLMRGNKETAIQTSPAVNTYLVANFSSGDSLPNFAQDCVQTACTTTPGAATNLANFQMNDWLARVQGELPGARVVVCFDGAPYASNGLPRWACNAGTNGIIVIKIGWSRQSTNRAASGSLAIEHATDASINPLVVLPVTPGT